MSPVIFNCVVCGQYVYPSSGSEAWLQRYRILYSSPEGTFVSGVGLYKNPGGGAFVVPLDYAARWDDPVCRLHQIGVMTRGPFEQRHGFIFHEDCWSLLEKTHHAQPVPYSRLYEVCHSMPFPLRDCGLSFGHDFGGLVLIDNKNYYSWEDRVFERDPQNFKQLQLTYRNPLNVPEVGQLLKKRRQVISKSRNLRCTRQTRQNGNNLSKSPSEEDTFGKLLSSSHIFNRLPIEIRDMIAYLLPTSDICNLRLASKAFFSVLEDQRFWATRFSPHSDRSWLPELWNPSGQKNWKWLYRCTNDTHLKFAFRNRKRVWKLAEHLRDLASLQWKAPSTTFMQHKKASSGYRQVSGDLTLANSAHGFNEGCRLLHQQCVSIPRSLTQIAFSVVHVGDTEYISGLRFVSSDGTAIEFGYWSEKKVYSANITSLWGFHVAAGIRGIQALQVIADEQHKSQWCGLSDECPKTRYLAVSKPVKALKLGFDGCKMVSLGIEYEDSSANDQSIEETKSLRDIELWFPGIPGHHLLLNEYPTLMADYYRPLCWVSFGGAGGEYLKSLTGMMAYGRGSIRHIEFSYDTNDVPAQIRKQNVYEIFKGQATTHFPIDGASGETIDAVEVRLEYVTSPSAYSYAKHGALTSLKISTNRGRNCTFGSPRNGEEIRKHAINITRGTTITGFYFSRHNQWGITCLGVISEVIGNKTDSKSV